MVSEGSFEPVPFTFEPVPFNDTGLEAAISVRDARPAHYSFKIESFSGLLDMLLLNGEEKYESSDFKVAGYKWRLALYPRGDNKGKITDHISFSLVFSEKNTIPSVEASAFFRLFVYDHINDKYVTIQDVNQKVVHFHKLKSECGFSQFIPFNTFYNDSNGYLKDDCCIFGAEVFVLNCTGKGESVLVPKNIHQIFPWKINNYSKLLEESIISEKFTLGGHQWYLKIYPNGLDTSKGRHLSFYLCLHNITGLSPEQKMCCGFKLRLKDQLRGQHYELTAIKTLTADSLPAWGFRTFLDLSALRNKSRGFLVNDTLIVEAQFTSFSKRTVFS